MKSISKKTNNKKVYVAVTLSILSLAALTYFSVAFFTQSLWPYTTSTGESSTYSKKATANSESTIDYSEPTPDEIKASQDGKKNTTEESAEDNSSKQTAVVAVTYSSVTNGKFEIRAFTPSTVEGGGTCEAVLKKGTLTVTAGSTAFIDSSTTQCNPIYIDTDQFPQKGEWILTVTFSSKDTSGTSEKVKVTL